MQEKDTVVLSADEMILTTATAIQKVWLPKGEYPKIECSTGGRKRRNVYGFLNIKTGGEKDDGILGITIGKDFLQFLREADRDIVLEMVQMDFQELTMLTDNLEEIRSRKYSQGQTKSK